MEQETRNNEQDKRNKKQELRNKEQEKSNLPPKRVILRDFSKGIFFYPLAIYSFIAAIIENFGESGNPAQPWEHANVLSVIWLVVFFANIFIVSFDFSIGKFIALIFLVVLIVILVVLLTLNSTPFVFNLEIRTQFYWMTAAFTIAIVFLALLAGQFRFVKLEQNEVLIKGILGDVKRFPTSSLSYEKKIPDIFKYMLLGSGTIILHVPGMAESVALITVINVHKKAKQMDAILSTLKISR